MGIAEEMRKIAENVIFAYQSKIPEVAAIIDNTSQILEDFKIQRNEMSSQLKEILAKEESLRKKDFDKMMQDIISWQDKSEKEVKNLLKTFFDEQKDIAELVRKNLTGEEKIKIDDFRKRLKDIQAMQKSREKEVSAALRRFLAEYKQMAASLGSLLNKGETVRIKDLKEMVKDIRTRQTGASEANAKKEIRKGGEAGEKQKVGEVEFSFSC